MQAMANLILSVNISSVVEKKFHNTHLMQKFRKEQGMLQLYKILTHPVVASCKM